MAVSRLGEVEHRLHLHQQMHARGVDVVRVIDIARDADRADDLPVDHLGRKRR